MFFILVILDRNIIVDSVMLVTVNVHVQVESFLSFRKVEIFFLKHSCIWACSCITSRPIYIAKIMKILQCPCYECSLLTHFEMYWHFKDHSLIPDVWVLTIFFLFYILILDYRALQVVTLFLSSVFCKKRRRKKKLVIIILNSWNIFYNNLSP